MKNHTCHSFPVLVGLMVSVIVQALVPAIPFSVNGSGVCVADTFLAGEVSGVWDASVGNFLIYDSIWVDYGNSLVINQGVHVQFAIQTGGLSVYGNLTVNGTAEDSVYFTSSQSWPVSGDWGRVALIGTQTNTSVIEYCVFSYAQKGLRLQDSSPEISHCSFLHNSQQGIYASNSSFSLDSADVGYNGERGIATWGGGPTISNVHSYYNTDHGIYENNSYNAEIFNCIFEYNGNSGIYIIDDCYNIEISYCHSRYNNDYGLRVEECYAAGVPIKIHHNLFYHNVLDGIYSDNSNLKVYNNTITDNSRDGIFSYGGNFTSYSNIVDSNGHRGIYVQDSQYTIDYNDVWNNYTTDYLGCSAGSHDISLNPQYLSPSSNDYHLQAGSPCIDAGNPAPSYNDPDGTVTDIGALFFNQSSVFNSPGLIPDSKILLINYPNPFNSETTITFDFMSDHYSGEIVIYDVLGQRVKTYLPGSDLHGSFVWDGRDETGQTVSSGVFFCRAGRSECIRMILQK